MSNIDLESKVRPAIKKLKAYHVDAFDCEVQLHANESPYPPPPELLQSLGIQLGDLELNRYPDPACQTLRATIAKRIGLAAGQIVVGNGSDEMIQILMQIFCESGDCVAFPDPTFAMYSIIAQSMGVEPLAVPLDENWDFTAEFFLKSVESKNPKIIFFSYPNNPTGNCFSADAIQKIIESFSGIVVLDEAYQDFSGKTFVAEMARHNNLVMLRSLSKIGLAGLRVGYCAADPYVAENIDKVRLPYNSNSVSQIISEKLLANFSMIETQIEAITKERDRLMAALAEPPEVTVFPSDSNFILFRVKEADALFKTLADRGVLIRNLGSHPRLTGCLRVTVGTREENDRFLSKMKLALRDSTNA